ncbi:MAG: hypothetical protein ABEI74_04745 [Candidatus Pacearchaeota archaeon]
MAYKEINDFNTTGIGSIFKYSADVVPAFIPLVLVSVFIVSTLGSYFAQMRRQGEGDFPGSFAVGSWITAIVAVTLSLFDNLIRTGTVVSSIALAIIGMIWLYVSRMESTGF